jgi:branched-chain amino acid transport system substrate-binding protein
MLGSKLQPSQVPDHVRRRARGRREAACWRRPSSSRAQGASVKLGVLHPVSGALSYSGQQGRLGAQIAIEQINAAGGLKALNGAKIEPVLGDAQSTPDGGTAEVEKMNSAGVAAIVGGYGSSICLAVSQAAARYYLPYMVDVGVADGIVTRGLKNTFRFGPGFGVIAKTALDNLTTINDAAGKPAKTVMIVNEDSLFGSGLAKLLNEQLPQRGFQVLETIPHPTPTRDFNNVVLKIKAQNPDIVIPADYYNECALPAPCSSSGCGRRRCIRCSAAPLRPASSSRNSPRLPATSLTAITGSTRATPRRWRSRRRSRRRASSTPTRCS